VQRHVPSPSLSERHTFSSSCFILFYHPTRLAAHPLRQQYQKVNRTQK
jgi:hypothetical protein